MNNPIRFDLVKAKIKRARAGKDPITSFTLRETDGRDEELAAGQAKARGGEASTQEELVRLSIIMVNDKPVPQPYIQFDAWNTRARGFALKAFNETNGHTKEEEDAFLGTAEEVEAPPPFARAAGPEID